MLLNRITDPGNPGFFSKLSETTRPGFLKKNREFIEPYFQDAANQGARGVRKYVGPVTVAVQELDGWFSYTMAVETVHSKHDITCHSKSRRNKKKKIPLCTNEEVDMDLK